MTFEEQIISKEKYLMSIFSKSNGGYPSNIFRNKKLGIILTHSLVLAREHLVKWRFWTNRTERKYLMDYNL